MKKPQTGLLVTVLAFSLLSSCTKNEKSISNSNIYPSVTLSQVLESSVQQKYLNQDVEDITQNLKNFNLEQKPISDINPVLKTFIQKYKTLSSNTELKSNIEFIKTLEELENFQNNFEEYLKEDSRSIERIQKQLQNSHDYRGKIDGKPSQIIEDGIRSFLNKKIKILQFHVQKISPSVKSANNTPTPDPNIQINPAKSDFKAEKDFFLSLLASVLASFLTIVFLGWQNNESFTIIKILNDKINKRHKDFSEGTLSQIDIQIQDLKKSLSQIVSSQKSDYDALEHLIRLQMDQLNELLQIAQGNILQHSQEQLINLRNSQTNEDLNSQILSLKSRIQVIENDNTKLRVESNDTYQQKQELEQKLNNLRQNWQEEQVKQQQFWQQQYEQINTQLRQAEEESENLRNSLINQDLYSQIEQLQKHKDKLESRIQIIENDNAKLRAESNDILRQKQESEQKLNSLQQNWQEEQGKQQQFWQQQYEQINTQLRQAKEENERINKNLIDTQDDNSNLVTKNQKLEKRLEDLQPPPDAKSKAISPEIAQLVNTYNSNPNLLKQCVYTAAEVDVDEDSYVNYRRDDREQVILKTLASGSSKYLIVSLAGVSSIYLLFPKEKAISQSQSGPVQALFKCERFKVGVEFKLNKPAQVLPIAGVRQQEWRLEKQGELEFIS